jgi:type III HopA1-like effector protein
MGESAAEKELREALKKPLSMHSSLTEFLRRAFGDRGLMAAPEDVDWKLYKLYNSPAKSAGLESDVPTLKKFVNELWSKLASAAGVRASGILQRNNKKFADLEQLANGLVDPTSKIQFIEWCADFLYFRVGKGNVAVRLYANVLFDYGPDAMELLASYAAKTKDHGLVDMKIAGPAVLKMRSDVIVVYCSSKEAAQAAGAELLKQKSWLGTKCPEMTTPITSGLGLSTGAEPDWQATGLKSDASISPKAQSFGTIRCELIAMAIHNFNANKGTMGSSFEVFQKFVQVAFLGYGLDPAQPGD